MTELCDPFSTPVGRDFLPDPNPVEMARCRGMTAEWSCERRRRCERYRRAKFPWMPGEKLDRLCYSGYTFFVEARIAECADEF